MKKKDFIKLICACEAPEHFDQDILDRAAAMFEKWGLQAHETWAETDKEHLFQVHGLSDKTGVYKILMHFGYASRFFNSIE